MAETLEAEPMAKQRGRPKGEGRNDRTAKVDATVLGRVKSVADYRGISVAELLSELLEGPADRAYFQMMKELEAKTKWDKP